MIPPPYPFPWAVEHRPDDCPDTRRPFALVAANGNVAGWADTAELAARVCDTQ